MIALHYFLADTNDFNSSPLSVVFEVDEGKQITYKEIVNLSITDDDVNEATEQYFVVTMDTARAENRSAIMIATESSLCVIVDNDRKLIIQHQHSVTVHPCITYSVNQQL